MFIFVLTIPLNCTRNPLFSQWPLYFFFCINTSEMKLHSDGSARHLNDHSKCFQTSVMLHNMSYTSKRRPGILLNSLKCHWWRDADPVDDFSGSKSSVKCARVCVFSHHQQKSAWLIVIIEASGWLYQQKNSLFISLLQNVFLLQLSVIAVCLMKNRENREKKWKESNKDVKNNLYRNNSAVLFPLGIQLS